MNPLPDWQVEGIYFEGCNCDSVCPCYSARPPTYGYCEGNCAWHIRKGNYGETVLDGLNVILVQRCEGLMRTTIWQCWFYFDEHVTDAQFDALKQIFTAADERGHLGRIFHRLWQVQSVQRARIEMNLTGWQHRTSILGRLGLAIGRLKTEAGPTLCRVPNIHGVAALAEQDWFDDGAMKFDYKNQNALTTTFAYHSA
jgi:hypothetical protein